MDQYAREEAALERGRSETTLLQLAGTVNQLSHDVRLIMLFMLPIAVTALVLSLVSFALVLAK